MSKTEHNQKLIVAISGASGAVYGINALKFLKHAKVETHLVVSRAAALSLSAETDFSLADVHALADVVYKPGDIGAAIASGSFRTLGMLIAPCSIKSLSEIATGVTSGLVSRAADVCLKERRRLVLMVRESPLHLGHLRTMAAVTEMGAIVAPPMPALYTRPQTVEEIINQSVGRALDLFGIEVDIHRWQGLKGPENVNPENLNPENLQNG
ncbi:3-octaprenyl-4-hydroxybenzoate carboxy-lyase [Asticcacaulis biprosthecium C19]|uniref:Flavin prenyltransferase UbiX n=1 Tax=Asticcacaulis biprosthecium C19 TaxID=715226 RepID=F4QL84_9CAUL|nr:UbiX family flavin prenyltransferase [Asticcacaulis biprosthecium]EGF93459.1 3-octaprenyl-4-hydroxybenzoate carboxy-lyase [Asticcacaulis biprosthecium C19]